MKKLIVFILTLATAQAYAVQHPETADVELKKHFPQASDIQWKKADDSLIEARFISNDQEMSAFFTSTGSFVEADTEVSFEELPTIIKALSAYYVEKSHCYYVKSIDSNNHVVYSMYFQNNNHQYQVLMEEGKTTSVLKELK
ncbi:MAG: hypothetical protein U0U66_12400 [Cytophagaceae bacterium]